MRNKGIIRDMGIAMCFVALVAVPTILAYRHFKAKSRSPLDAPQFVATLGHSGKTSSAVFSPDGKLILSGGEEDKVAILWDATTGYEIRRFIGHIQGINSVAFSPDGQFALTGGGYDRFESGSSEVTDFTARLWDIRTGKELQRFTGHSEAINSVAFSPDGKSIVTGSDDATIRLWNTDTGKEIRRFLGHSAPVHTVAFSPNGQIVASGSGNVIFNNTLELISEDCTARLWDVATGKQIRAFSGHSQEVGAIAFSIDGRIYTGALPPRTLAFPDGYEAATIKQWDILTGKEIAEYKGLGPLSISPNNEFIANGGSDETLLAGTQVWRAKSGEKHRYFVERQADKGIVRSLTFSPNNQTLLVTFSVIEDGGSLGSSSGQNSMRIFDIQSGRELLTLGGSGPENRLPHITFSPSGEFILAGEHLWDTFNSRKVQLRDYNNQDDPLHVRESIAYAVDEKLTVLGERKGSETAGIEAYTLRDQKIGLWENETGKKVGEFGEGESAWLSKDRGHLLVQAELHGESIRQINFWDVQSGQLKWQRSFQICGSNAELSYESASRAFSKMTADGKIVVFVECIVSEKVTPQGIFAENSFLLNVLNADSGEQIKQLRYDISTDQNIPAFFFLNTSVDGRFIAIPASQKRAIAIYDVQNDKIIRQISLNNQIISVSSFSPDGNYLATTASGNSTDGTRIWKVNTGQLVQHFPQLGEKVFGQIALNRVDKVAFSPDNRFLLSIRKSVSQEVVSLWSISTGKESFQFMHRGAAIYDAAFSPDSKLVFTVGRDGTTRIWSIETGQEICRLISFRNGTWLTVTPDGRFDTNNLEDISEVQWVMSDDPLRPIPLTTFARQYYEPKLLARVLAGEKFKPLPSLAELNRTQPEVKITGIKPEAADTVQITVAVANAKSEGQKDTLGNPLESGVYDVRLFRDGKLVGYAPKNAGATETASWWRSWWPFGQAQANDGVVELDKDGKATLTFSNVRLPSTGVGEVEFSAYAFNSDRIKSATSRQTFKLPQPAQVKGRAYVVSLGVNIAGRESLRLRYAANDARAVQTQVAGQLAALPDADKYAEVVGVALVSDTDERGQTVANSATKAHLRAVLDALAGRAPDAALLRDIPNADKLRPARPEDLVIISASSHGYTDGDGIFYLVPSDVGQAAVGSQEFREHCVSSDELSRWLRDVDAGELALVVDACHSAAAVEGTDFKPGPMGSRGLGELSYDKGMRILTATQAADVALENNSLRQGLLSYALTNEGLGAWQADRDGNNAVLLKEWLNYGVERVPRLHEEVKAGRIQSRNAGETRIVREAVAPAAVTEDKYQQPSLFDFSRGRQDPALAHRR